MAKFYHLLKPSLEKYPPLHRKPEGPNTEIGPQDENIVSLGDRDSDPPL